MADAATGAEDARAPEGRPGLVLKARAITVGGPLLALAIAILFFSIKSDRFLSGGNFSLILQQVMVVGTLAIGQTLIILTAGIDLSCGAVMAFGGILIAKLAVEGTLPPLVAIAAGILVCGGFGLLNGLLVRLVPLPPFI